MPTLRTLRNKADQTARTLGHDVRFSTLHSHAMWGECKQCGAHVAVSNDKEESRQIVGDALRETCADYRAQYPKEQTTVKRVRGRMVACRRLGVWTDDKGRRYTAWRSAVNSMSAWVRMEPFDGGRAQNWYDPGAYYPAEIRRQEQAQAGA